MLTQKRVLRYRLRSSMNYIGPKVRLSRRVGLALTPKAARIMERNPNPPGKGPRTRSMRRTQTSDYKLQLIEKQKLRYQYNVHERQLRNYVHKAGSKAGNTADNLVGLLETRLDAVVLRAGLTRTVYTARQVVSHKHITVNGRRINIPSYQVRPGDVVAVREVSQKLAMFRESLASSRPAPPYMTVSADEMSVKLLARPQRQDVPIICEVPMVVEYYSK